MARRCGSWSSRRRCSQGDPTSPERLHRAHEGHLAGQLPGADRGGPGRVRLPDREHQRIRFDPGRDPVPGGDDPAGKAVDWLIAREATKTSAAVAAAVASACRRSRMPTGMVGAYGWKAGRSRAMTRHGAARRAVNEGGSILKLEGVRKRFGSLEVLRGVDLEVDRGKVTCVIGPSGSASRRCCAASTCSSRRTRAGSCSRGRRSPAGWSATRPRLHPPAGRDGVPAVQPVPAQVGARERLAGAAEGARPRPDRRRPRSPRRCWRASGSPTSSTSTRTASRAASSSGSRSRGRWRWTRT